MISVDDRKCGNVGTGRNTQPTEKARCSYLTYILYIYKYVEIEGARGRVRVRVYTYSRAYRVFGGNVGTWEHSGFPLARNARSFWGGV